ncbi:MAG TPA: hypothetical protein VK843_17840 [Planctomycetota bacterium]|nr:hypothetical protein [Planctomycetota bacterium]
MELRIATCRPMPEVDADEDLLLAALSQRGVRARMAAWNDTEQDWDAPVPTLLRSTWDYIHDLPAFRSWLSRVAHAAPLWNPRSIVEANLHKGYLLDLERRGVPIVPTELVERGSATSLREIMKHRAWDAVVVKPAVGAGSFATQRFAAGEISHGERFQADHLPHRDMLVQPYLDAVEGHGERALVWIDGEFTHAVRKSPRFGGQDERVSEALPIAAEERALGELTLGPLASQLLYARVDVAHGPDGRLCLMELELIEPSLFLKQEPRALERFAAAIARNLRAVTSR